MPKPPRPTSPAFSPARRKRARHDGWTPERQLGFIDALAASGCVAEACAAVGMSRQAAYALRVTPEAQQFRMAWDAALDLGVRRLADACMARAIEGVPVPHFYKGEQVGEHRRYDGKLAMFLLRYRDPLRYAASLDHMVYTGHAEGAGVRFARARNAVHAEAHDAAHAVQLSPWPPYAAEPIAEVARREPDPAPAPVDAWADEDPLRRLRAERAARAVSGEGSARERLAAKLEEMAARHRVADGAPPIAATAPTPPPEGPPGEAIGG